MVRKLALLVELVTKVVDEVVLERTVVKVEADRIVCVIEDIGVDTPTIVASFVDVVVTEVPKLFELERTVAVEDTVVDPTLVVLGVPTIVVEVNVANVVVVVLVGTESKVYEVLVLLATDAIDMTEDELVTSEIVNRLLDIVIEDTADEELEKVTLPVISAIVALLAD